MVFAQGGDAALSACERTEFDVVVSDMRMPGMDGAQLLQRIKRRDTRKHEIRIVLSGHADRQAVMRALPVAHQYLSKPCDAEVLRGVIARALTLQRLMNNEPLRKLVGRVERLPSVSSVYAELTQVLARDSPSIDDVVAVVERDSCDVPFKFFLQVVKLGVLRPLRDVCSAMRDAIAYLGYRASSKSLVVAACRSLRPAEGAAASTAAWLQRRIQIHSVFARRACARAPPRAGGRRRCLHGRHAPRCRADPRPRARCDSEWLSERPGAPARDRGVACHVVERERPRRHPRRSRGVHPRDLGPAVSDCRSGSRSSRARAPRRFLARRHARRAHRREPRYRDRSGEARRRAGHRTRARRGAHQGHRPARGAPGVLARARASQLQRRGCGP